MKTDTKTRKKMPSLAAKQAFVVRTRAQNYRASLRLEGFEVSDDQESSDKKKAFKQQVIEKYRQAAG